jgi:hypothetical protein
MSGLPKADMCGRFMSTRLKSSLAVYATSGGLISYGLISSTIFGARRLAWMKGTRRDLIRSHSTAIDKTIVRLLATFDRHKT